MIICYDLVFAIFGETWCIIVSFFMYKFFLKWWNYLYFRYQVSIFPFNERFELIWEICLFFPSVFFSPEYVYSPSFLSKVIIRFLCLAFNSLEIEIPCINIVIAVDTGHVLYCFQTRHWIGIVWAILKLISFKIMDGSVGGWMGGVCGHSNRLKWDMLNLKYPFLCILNEKMGVWRVHIIICSSAHVS